MRDSIKQQTLAYITAALALVAGLAWNELIKSLIAVLFPVKSNSLWAQLIYAVIVTLIVVLATISLTKLLNKRKEEQNNG